MDNEIVIYTAGYLAVRIAVVAAFGYALFQVLCVAPARIRREPARTGAAARADTAADERC